MNKATSENNEDGVLNKTDEKLEIVQKLRPIDDTLFSVVYNSKEACQELLATVLGDPRLTVRDVTIQHSKIESRERDSSPAAGRVSGLIPHRRSAILAERFYFIGRSFL